MKMIKLFFILLLYVLPTFAVAQTKNDSSYTRRMTDGKKLYNEACDLRKAGKNDDANLKNEKAKNCFIAATNYAMTEKQKDELTRWKNKCEQFPPKTLPVSPTKRWIISWDEEQQSIQLKCGNQTVLYKMIQVEGGTYKNDETIMSFSVGETEVTELLWNVVMKGGVSTMNLKPKTNVSWTECKKFIEKLEEKTGIIFRLPEASEWEFAASGGNKTKGFEYAGSNDLSQITNLYKKLQPVKKYKANELELYDMTGNVYEWTSTQSEHGGYILKGGSFREANINGYLNKKKLKILDSEHFPENDKQDRFGFRIVKSYE